MRQALEYGSMVRDLNGAYLKNWLDHVQLRREPRFLKGTSAKKERNVTDALKKLLDEMTDEMNHVFNYCRYEIKGSMNLTVLNAILAIA